jgi:hypothetical protein
MLNYLIQLHHQVSIKELTTLFLAADILERFLCLRKMSSDNYKLLVITSLFIASKMQEVYAPSLRRILVATTEKRI